MDPRRVALATLVTVIASGCTEAVAPDPTGKALELVVEGLRSPVFLTAAGDDRLFVVEKAGRILVLHDGIARATPFIDITTSVSSNGERGLLSVAFHPDYASNGFFFLNYTDGAGDTRIVRYTVSADPDRADAGSASAVLTVPQPFSNHNGGQIAFGPDGMLYIGLGDGGSGGDPQGHGQSPLTLLGSMLRIDVDGGPPYSIPATNPFVGNPGAAPESWAVGLRNPWRFSFDRQTGDLYIADVGQSEIEEISVQRAVSGGGENYGWNTMEGSRCFAAPSCDMTGLVLPSFEYTHAEGCSVTGGYVYRGQAIPTLRGRYLFADFCSPWIRSLDTASGSLTDLFDHTPDFGPVSRIVSFGEDHRGELSVISLDGVVYRIVE